MEKTFEINGKTYIAREFDFNMLADFGEMGVDASIVFTSPISACRAYLTLCGNMPKETAGKELETHILNGGSLEEIETILADNVLNSDFFQKVVATQTKKKATTKNTSKK